MGGSDQNSDPAGDGRSLESTEAWRAIRDEFLKTGDAARAQGALAQVVDGLAAEAYRATMEPVLPKSAALVAAHGENYLYPYADQDLLVLLESGKQSQAARERLPELVRRLEDAGLRANLAVLAISGLREAIEGNGARLSLPGRRFLAGDRAVFEELEKRLPAAWESYGQKPTGQIREAAVARHARFGNTSQYAEPDVKDAPGGVEDLRLVDALAALKPAAEDAGGELQQAAALVARARWFLHYRAAADSNILDFEAQRELARLGPEGRAPAEWMRGYLAGARAIFHAARHAIERSEKAQSSLVDGFREHLARLSNAEFTVSRGRLLLRNPAQLAGDPGLILRLLEFIGRHGVRAAAETERRLEAARDAFAAWCNRPESWWAEIKGTLVSPHAAMALRTLEAAGLMPALVPEWGAVEHLADPDFRYTVDEQVMLGIERLGDLRSPEGADRQRFAGLLADIDDAAVPLLALLFQPAARGEADSLRLAATRAGAALARIGMPAEGRRAVEFLVEHQADLSEAASGRDMEDPATARYLAERVGTVEQLQLLALTTYARTAAATGDETLPWRLERLWRAYTVTRQELMRELETGRIQELPANLAGNTEFLRGFPVRYLRAHAAAEIETHLELFRSSLPTGVAVRLDALEGTYRLTVAARDKPFMFASFAAAISSFGLDILHAEAFSNARGFVLDTFVFADAKHLLRQHPAEADRLTDLMQQVALGKTNAEKLMRGRALPAAGRHAAAQVVFDSEACPTATRVEIAAEDRPGLLYSLATVFSSNACNIDVVLVDTKGRRAIDVFYVAQDGRKLAPETQALLLEKLLAAC